MFGIILIVFSTLFLEISTAIGKTEVKSKKENIYIFGFLALFWSMVWFFVIALFKHGFYFNFDSLPTLIIRIIFEIILTEISIRAITTADRSTNGFIRILTLPLVLLIDFGLGYSLNSNQLLGIVVICLTLGAILYFHGVNKKGIKLAMLSSILAAIPISLYKYNIAHFNSVEAEQLIVYIVLFVYFMFRMQMEKFTNPFKLLFKQPFAAQSLTHGIGGVMSSFAFMFAPASVIVAGERSLAILWAILSGNLYFKEKHLLTKVGVFIFLVIGIYLLIP